MKPSTGGDHFVCVQSVIAASGVQAAPTGLFPTDGLWLDFKGRIYLSDINHKAVRLTLSGGLETVAESYRLQWTDTFTEDPEGNVYISASHINQSPIYNKGYSTRHGEPYGVFRIANTDPQ